MKRTIFQHPTLLDEKGNVVQQGTYSKESPLVNSTNDGVLDYINNNLEALRDNINGSRIYVKNKDALTTPGDISAMYIAEDTGKWYLWDGTKYIETDNARKIADEAIAARDAAKASQTAAKTSEQNAKTSETNAAVSKQAAATSAGAAKTSENNAGTQANTAKAWATATTSPDGAADTASSTGKTQSARSWALYSKDRATASASSASAAATSAGNAKASETNAANSKTAAATSADNAATSANAAANSAKAAADSARVNQADWNVTDTTNQAFIKNKPDIVLSGTQNVSSSLVINPTVFSYNECMRMNQSSTGWATIYLGADLNTKNGNQEGAWGISRDPSKAFGIWPNVSYDRGRKGLYMPLNGRATLDGKTIILEGDTVDKAKSDADGNTITGTYLKKSDAQQSVTTNTLTATDATFTGQTTVPTANAGNSSKAIANTEFVAKSLASLVNGAPDQLNTLNELAKALGNDSNFASTVMAELAKKLNSAEAESTYATKTEARVLPGTVTAFSGTFKDGFPINKNTGLANREWHLCDGTNGTPDLRSRFIYGGDGTNNGATGGEVSHKLTLAELPAFTPSIRTSRVNSRPNTTDLWHRDRDRVACGSDDPEMRSEPFASIGGNQPHNNMPPYYVLAFIMKL